MMLIASLALPIWWALVTVGLAGLAVLWARDRRAEAAHEARCEAIEAAPRRAWADTTELSILPYSVAPRSHRPTPAWRRGAVARWSR